MASTTMAQVSVAVLLCLRHVLLARVFYCAQTKAHITSDCALAASVVEAAAKVTAVSMAAVAQAVAAVVVDLTVSEVTLISTR